MWTRAKVINSEHRNRESKWSINLKAFVSRFDSSEGNDWKCERDRPTERKSTNKRRNKTETKRKRDKDRKGDFLSNSPYLIFDLILCRNLPCSLDHLKNGTTDTYIKRLSVYHWTKRSQLQYEIKKNRICNRN